MGLIISTILYAQKEVNTEGTAKVWIEKNMTQDQAVEQARERERIPVFPIP